jgi:hypothetical protein
MRISGRQSVSGRGGRYKRNDSWGGLVKCTLSGFRARMDATGGKGLGIRDQWIDRCHPRKRGMVGFRWSQRAEV